MKKDYIFLRGERREVGKVRGRFWGRDEGVDKYFLRWEVDRGDS